MRFQVPVFPLLIALLAAILGWSVWLVRRHSGNTGAELPDGLLIGLMMVAVLGLGIFLFDVLSVAH